MKRKLLSLLVVLTLAGVGYCKPPVEDCVGGLRQNPAVCRGFIGPK
jgi:hypothetical protein